MAWLCGHAAQADWLQNDRGRMWLATKVMRHE